MREQSIKEKAYQIWEAEGCPDGRAEAHWEMAKRELVGRQVPDESARTKPAARPRRAASGKGRARKGTTVS